MARSPKNVTPTQASSEYCIIDTASEQDTQKRPSLHRIVSKFEQAANKAVFGGINGLRAVGFATTVDVAGYTSENPQKCEVTLTYRVTLKPTLSRLYPELSPDGGYAYPESVSPEVE
jgi:hypothetical protein